MPQGRVLQIDGFEELLQALRDAPEEAEPFVREAMINSLLLIEGPLRLYPAATEANSPARGRWYERGYGPKWRTASGAVHGLRESEQLGKRWTHRIDVYRDGVQVLNLHGPVVEGIVGNNASYVMDVHAEETQRRYHKQRGWPTVEGVLDDAERDIYDEFYDAVGRWADRFNRGN